MKHIRPINRGNIRAYICITLVVFIYLMVTGCIDTSVKTPGNYVYDVDFINCTGCEACVAPCPETAIRIIEVDNVIRASIDTEKCIGCGECFFYCDLNAIIKVEVHK